MVSSIGMLRFVLFLKVVVHSCVFITNNEAYPIDIRAELEIWSFVSDLYIFFAASHPFSVSVLLLLGPGLYSISKSLRSWVHPRKVSGLVCDKVRHRINNCLFSRNFNFNKISWMLVDCGRKPEYLEKTTYAKCNPVEISSQHFCNIC